ncbi:MAG: cobalamin B12-binding domain-containing protein [Planctomycetes bacterium]|nr:cobalamin B12-binding domain-containing protein [Planctomycetota bacterium]
MKENRRVLIAKAGLDGHDRGAKVVASLLTEAGFEVIYTGLHQTPEMIARTAADEDVFAVGVSSLSGAHMTLFPKIRRTLDEAGLMDVVLFGGGIIPEDDQRDLKSMGVEAIFGPGTQSAEFVDFLNRRLTSDVRT